MSHLYCDQCDQQATVFALLPPYKACPLHAESLKERCPSVFTIATYNFIEQAEDYAEYEGRDTVEKSQDTAMQERHKRNRQETQSGLHTVKKVQSQIVTDPQLREVVEQYRLAGVGAREVGNYKKARKKLERGWVLLQQWAVESAEMCLQLGVVWAHFGEREEACTIYRRGLQHSSSPELSLQLNRSLVEVYFQTREWEETVKTAESVLALANGQEDSFELLQLLYFLTCSHFQLDNIKKGYELVNYWTSQIRVNSAESKSVLQVICARRKYEEGSNEEAVELYEETLPALELQSPNSYFTVYSRYCLAWIYAALKKQELTLSHYLKATTLYSAHFPFTMAYTKCLEHLAYLYKDMKNVKAAEAQFLKALTIYSAHFPLTKEYAVSLWNFGLLLKNIGRNGEAAARMEATLRICLFNNLQTDVTVWQCLGNCSSKLICLEKWLLAV